MGFLSRRLKRNRRGGLRPTTPEESSPAPRGNPLGHFLRTIGFLVFYIVWSSMTFPRSSGWRADLRIAIEKQLGWKSSAEKVNSKPFSLLQDTSTLFDKNGEDLEIPEAASTEHQQQHRIPCGLIVIDDRTVPVSSFPTASEDNVLPLATLAVVPTDEAQKKSFGDIRVPSTLHARALSKHPRLHNLVVDVPTSSPRRNDEAPGKRFKRMIPAGTFKLRMGSEESTIEESPVLWIVEEESNSENNNKNSEIDLVLGTTFWKSHRAEFESDEVYLDRKLSTSEQNTDKGIYSRVMVPFLRIRSRPSFGTEDDL